MSNEERWFMGWLKEMESYGLITDIEYQPHPFALIPNWDIPVRGSRFELTILTAMEYRPDFKFRISDKLKDKLYFEYLGREHMLYNNPITEKIPLVAIDGVCYVDTKGSAVNPKGGNNSAITFPIKQAWLLQQYGKYINKVTITQNPERAKNKTRYKNNYKYFQNLDFFACTFYPNCYLYTEKGNERKISKGNIPYTELGLKNVENYLKNML